MARMIQLTCLMFAIFGLYLSVIPNATAQSLPRTITVSGNGSAAVRPDFMLLHFKIVASNEKLVDARTAFTKLKTSVENKIGEMNEVTLETEFHGEVQAGGKGPSAVLMAIIGDGGDDGTFTVVEDATLRVEFDGEMERLELARAVPGIIDTLVDTGISFGGDGAAGQLKGKENVIEFGVDDPSIIETKVTESAMKDARRKAAHLAELAGGRLGRVVSIEMLEPVQKSDAESGIMAIYGMATAPATNDTATTPGFNRDIKQKGRLRVVFELLE